MDGLRPAPLDLDLGAPSLRGKRPALQHSRPARRERFAGQSFGLTHVRRSIRLQKINRDSSAFFTPTV
jgi:hypothetical protein